MTKDSSTLSVAGLAPVIGQQLFIDHAGIMLPFADLPFLAKRAIRQHLAESGERSPLSRLWGIVYLPMTALVGAIEARGLPRRSMRCFADYQRWYARANSLACHQMIWPVILDASGDEIIWDGWHRFHGYVAQQVAIIPAILPLPSAA